MSRRCAKCGGPLPVELDGGCPACLAQLLSRQPAQAPRPLAAGDEFQDYVILEVLGRGGMGIVYKARQKSLNRVVALKILIPSLAESDEFCRRFEAEARALAALNHPNIVQVYEFGKDGDRLFLAMEFVDGSSLEARLIKKDLDLPTLLAILRDVALGLERIHAAGLVHRDIKPANVLLDREGRAKISDFGLAIEPDAPTRLTNTGAFIGSVHYVSPEHIQLLDVDGRSDLYALGVVLFEALAGRRPFDGPSTPVVLSQHLNDPPPLGRLAGIAPRRIAKLVSKLLAKEPGKRTGSARALIEEIEAAMPEARTFRPGRFVATAVARIQYALATPRGAAALVVLVLLGVGSFFLFSEWKRAKIREILTAAEARYAAGDFDEARRRAEEAGESEAAQFLLDRIRIRQVMERRGISRLHLHSPGTELIPTPPEPALDLDGALARFREVADGTPEARDAALYAALAYHQKEQFAEARAQLLKLGNNRDAFALRLTAQVTLGLARVHSDAERDEEAATCCNEAIALFTLAGTPLSRLLHATILFEEVRHRVGDEVRLRSLVEICERTIEGMEGAEAAHLRAWCRFLRVQKGLEAPTAERLKSVEAAFDRTVDLDPAWADGLVSRGHFWSWTAEHHPDAASRRSESYRNAERDYRSAFARNANLVYAAIHAELAAVAAEAGDAGAWDRCIRALEDLAVRFPASAYARFACAQVRVAVTGRIRTGAAAETELKAALQSLEEAIRLRPGYADAHVLMGGVCRRLRDFERSIKAYELAIAAAPARVEGYVGLADARQERGDQSQDPTGDYSAAIEDLGRAIRRDSKNGEHYRKRGALRSRLSAYDEAVRDLTKAIELDPRDAAAYRERAHAKNWQAVAAEDEKGRLALWREALKDIDQALVLVPGDLLLISTRAVLRTNLGAPSGSAIDRALLERALEDYDAAIRVLPRHAALRLNKGKCLTHLGRKAEAVAELERAKSLDPAVRDEAEYWIKKNGGKQ